MYVWAAAVIASPMPSFVACNVINLSRCLFSHGDAKMVMKVVLALTMTEYTELLQLARWAPQSMLGCDAWSSRL